MNNKEINIQLALHDSCTGCGACVAVCPGKCIVMVVGKDGFLRPKIDSELCVGCHKCENTCPALHCVPLQRNDETEVFAAVINDEIIRKSSSSGGAFFGLAKCIINKGGVVFGAKFQGVHLRHDYTDNIDGLYSFMGSKYIQSDIGDSYEKVKFFLLQDRYVLFSGTPCQIAGLNRFLHKSYEKLITVDLLCHGVPSPSIWEKYIKRQMKKLGARDIKDIKFRTKREDIVSPINFYFFFFFLGSDGEWHEFGEDCQKNLYFSYFMRHLFRPSCYHCQYRGLELSQADFTIGDCWNVQCDHPEMSDNRGVSTILLHTFKSKHIMSDLKGVFMLEEENVSIMIERFLEARREEMEEKKRRLWKISNMMARVIPLEYMQCIYKHDRIDYVIKRKLSKVWQRSIE